MVTDCTEFLALVVASTLMFMRNKNVEFSPVHAVFKSITLFDTLYPLIWPSPKVVGIPVSIWIIPTIHLEVFPNLAFACLNVRSEGLGFAHDIAIEFPQWFVYQWICSLFFFFLISKLEDTMTITEINEKTIKYLKFKHNHGRYLL